MIKLNLKMIFQSNYNNNQKYFLTLISKYKTDILLPLDIDIFSGRQLLEEIILECESNKLSNKTNNDFFNKKLDKIMRTNYLVDEMQKTNLNYIKENIFERNSDLVYMLSLEVKRSFCLKKYFDKLINKLNEFLEDENSNNSNDIKVITDNIFIELFNKGYSIKEISEKIIALFSSAIYDKNNTFKIPNTSFPTDLIKNISDPFELTNYINDLSFKDRINFIKKFYDTKEKVYYLIVPIEGVILNDNLIKCNKDITLYNPKFIDPFFMENKYQKYREDKFNVNYQNCFNACIKIKSSNCAKAYKIGVKKIDDYINILKLLSPNNNLNIINDYKLLLDEKKKEIAFSFSSYSNDFSKREFERNVHPLNEKDIFDDKNVKRINKNIENIIDLDEGKQSTAQILLNSIKKYSEGLDNKNIQEAILKFWSSIESLFNNNFKIKGKTEKFETIQEVLSAYMTYSSRYLPLHKLYDDLADIMGNSKYTSANNCLCLSKTLLKKLHLLKSSNKSFSLLPLIKYNKDIQKNLNDYYYLQKVKDIYSYFNDTNYCLKVTKQRKKEYESDLIIIYRLRNQIIHNALSNDITTEFYFPLLKRISNFFLNAVLDEYIDNKDLTIDEIILKIYAKSILYIKNIEVSPLLDMSH